jgi:hypothetical protein
MGIFTAESAEDAEKIQIQVAKSKIKIRGFGGALKPTLGKSGIDFFCLLNFFPSACSALSAVKFFRLFERRFGWGFWKGGLRS